MIIQYPYTYICFQVDKYEKFVANAIKSGNKKLLDVATDRWYFWMEKLIEFSN